MMAVGSITGAFLTARLRRPTYARVLVCAVLLGVAYLAAGRTANAEQFGLVLTPIGLLSNSFMSTSSALVQLRVHAQLQGRVTGLYMAATNALVPLGAVVIGMAASAWSPRGPLVVAGVMCIVGGAGAFAALLLLRVVAWKKGALNDIDPIEMGLS
jgi:MFS family permease